MNAVPLMTLEQHIHEEQRRHHPQATGEFSWLLSGVTLATKVIAAHVRRAGLTDSIGTAGFRNVQGETVQKLDVIANQALLDCLCGRGSVAVLASEENEEPIVVERDRKHGKYAVVFDPLDGSSNIDVGVSVGTIFSILQREPDNSGQRDPLQDVLQPGYRQVAAGYVIYGSSTIFVYTAGNGVYVFTLDPSIGAYLLCQERIMMPPSGTIYSVNEAYMDTFPPAYQNFIAQLRSGATGRRYSSRYVGSLVADFHRTLLKGGIFLYPPTAQHPEGKLRLMYEARPMAMIAEQAGGMACGATQRILEIPPTGLHQRTPLLVGSRGEMNMLLPMLEEELEFAAR
jgi:fructose-1,6-bisphosphatase I